MNDGYSYSYEELKALLEEPKRNMEQPVYYVSPQTYKILIEMLGENTNASKAES